MQQATRIHWGPRQVRTLRGISVGKRYKKIHDHLPKGEPIVFTVLSKPVKNQFGMLIAIRVHMKNKAHMKKNRSYVTELFLEDACVLSNMVNGVEMWHSSNYLIRM